ncbi:unnamed protein product [Mytilus edulis]|uniref:Uncharacterized protein n=1 Tax=Mytilus edulis TaxID=6550 RepID=A0A8S3V660_MYTED|nr:unnamed protein product [Mytilus edulis]
MPPVRKKRVSSKKSKKSDTPVVQNFSNTELTFDEVKEKLRKQGIRASSTFTKEQLLELLNENSGQDNAVMPEIPVLTQLTTSLNNMEYKGSVFYEYHKAFANKVAAIKLTHGKVVDWSNRDEKLYSSITSGQIIKECETCGSLGHLTAVCQTFPSFGQSNNRSKPTYNQTHFQKSQVGSNGRDD